jgi:EAL domain-containing protein (putative c-di-GMP-specific phosphodiesterase class I)
MKVTMENCILCDFRSRCSAPPLVLYPTTPILNDILGRLLEAERIRFSRQAELLLLPDITDQQFAEFAQNKLSEREALDIRITRSLTAAMMNAPRLSEWTQHTDTSWFDRALEADQFTTYFQPIVDYRTGQPYAHECLIRLHGDRLYNGGEIMEAAVSRGRIHVFDSYARRLSIRCAGRESLRGSKIFVNFMPSSIYDPAFCMKSTLAEMENTGLQPGDVVFEVVESDGIADRRHLRKICDYYHEHGFGFALDDVGTGSNSLQMMCDLNPDYIKIDKSLIRGVYEPMYRSTIQKIIELAVEYKIQVIAEGMEDAESAALLARLGINLMQGYYFGRPAPRVLNPAQDLVQLKSALRPESEVPVS